MIHAVDLFCGAGGTSTGIIKAITERLRRPYQLTAVNHWRTAVNTHSLNHPQVRHLCENVENVHPLDLIKSGHLDLLAASCECRFHSNARGGGPCNEQSRSQPWQLIRWATDIHVENILMENVREFMHWGPLNKRTKRPIKSRRGAFFKSFVNALIGLGYNVDFKVQVAANFGDATSRPRLMLIARKGNTVVFPEATHGPGCANPWNNARGIIDWSIKGQSVLRRKRPLSPNTLRRIEAGLRKFSGPNAEPFLILLRGTSSNHLDKHSAKSVDAPLPSVTAGGGHLALCEPFITAYHNGSGLERRNHSVDAPLPTQDTSNRFALVQPFITHLTHTGPPRCHSVDSPLPTVTCAHRGEMALVQPMIIKYYGKGENARSVDEPLPTVTTLDRFALVEPTTGREVGEIDILMRMLQPHELSASHSFPSGYQFTGHKGDKVKQIGNSVPVELACAHAHAALS